MTISSSTNRITYTGDGGTTVFSYTFKIKDADHLAVILTDASGAPTTLTRGVHYSVDGVDEDAGGDVTMVTPPAGTETLTLVRTHPITQTTDVDTIGTFRAQSIENGLDWLLLAIARVWDKASRSMSFREADDGGASSEWNADDKPIANVPTPTDDEHAANKAYVDAIEISAAGEASDAADSAAAAAVSAGEAAASASTASTAATTASGAAATVSAAIAGWEGQYYGPAASDPATRPDLTALQEGDLYYNTTADVMKVYNGASWETAYAPSGAYLAIAGGTMTGDLVLAGDPDAALKAATKQYVDANGGASAAVFYVSATEGNDANGGNSPGDAFATIAAALTAADAYVVANSVRATVAIIDGSTYTEDLTIPEGVDVVGPSAVIVGTMTLESSCTVHVYGLYSNGNNDVIVDKTGAVGACFVKAEVIDGRGVSGTDTGTTCIRNGSNGSVLFVMASQVWVAESGKGISDKATGFGHIHFWAPDLYLAGNSAVGIYADQANTNLIGVIDHILETGSPTTTTGISLGHASSIVKVTCTEIIADTAYNITAGDLHILCAKMTGTRTGTPAFEVSDAKGVLGTDHTTSGDHDGRYYTETEIDGFRGKVVDENAQLGTTYDIAASDAGKLVTFENAGAITVTFQPNSTTAIDIDTRIDFAQLGAGQVTFAPGAGVTLRSHDSKLKLTGQYAGASAVKIGTDEWLLVGNLSA